MLFKRLLRRLAWLLFYQWKSISLKAWPYETCQRCGKAFKIAWDVDDKTWQEVTGFYDAGGGSYCIDCFIELCNTKPINFNQAKFNICIFNPGTKNKT